MSKKYVLNIQTKQNTNVSIYEDSHLCYTIQFLLVSTKQDNLVKEHSEISELRMNSITTHKINSIKHVICNHNLINQSCELHKLILYLPTKKKKYFGPPHR